MILRDGFFSSCSMHQCLGNVDEMGVIIMMTSADRPFWPKRFSSRVGEYFLKGKRGVANAIIALFHKNV